jgi:hypothetical protein
MNTFIFLYTLLGLSLIVVGIVPKPIVITQDEVVTFFPEREYLEKEYIISGEDTALMGYKVCPICGGLYWASESDMSCGKTCEEVAIKIVLQDAFKPSTYADKLGYCAGCHSYTRPERTYCMCCLYKIATKYVVSVDGPVLPEETETEGKTRKDHKRAAYLKMIEDMREERSFINNGRSRKRNDKRIAKPKTKSYELARELKYNFEV